MFSAGGRSHETAESPRLNSTQVLERNPLVNAAAVVLVRVGEVSERLHAFVVAVPTSGQPVSRGDTPFAVARLPSRAVPDRVGLLSGLPRLSA